MCSESAAVSRDLPMPGSPEISTTRPSPLFACCQRRRSSSTSSSRPTSGVSARAQCLEAARRSPLSPQHPPRRLRLGKAGERLRRRDLRDRTARRSAGASLSAMTSVFGAARACSRAARFGVSPTTAALLRRSPRRSDRRPRQARWRCRAARCKSSRAGNRPTASITASPARTARSASSSCARG